MPQRGDAESCRLNQGITWSWRQKDSIFRKPSATSTTMAKISQDQLENPTTINHTPRLLTNVSKPQNWAVQQLFTIITPTWIISFKACKEWLSILICLNHRLKGSTLSCQGQKSTPQVCHLFPEESRFRYPTKITLYYLMARYRF